MSQYPVPVIGSPPPQLTQLRVCGSQSAEAGERDEHEPEREAGRPAAGRPPPRDDGGAMRDPHPAAGADQIGGVVPVGGVGGQAGHGGDKTGAGHRAGGQGGDRGAQGVRRPARGAHASQEAAAAGAGLFHRSLPPVLFHSVFSSCFNFL